MSNTTKLIRKILVTRTNVYLGESFKVIVKTVDDSEIQPIHVTINGTLGREQYLQFADYPGTRKISVGAFTDNKLIENRETEIEVLPLSDCQKLPIIDIEKDNSGNYQVRCSVKNADSLALKDAFYEWSFGKEPIYSQSPSAILSFEESLDRDSVYQTFDVNVTIHRSDETKITAWRSVTFWNDYAINKQRGIITSPIKYDFIARRQEQKLNASCKVKNLEDISLFLTERQIEFLYNDPDKLSVPSQPEPIQIDIEPHSEREIDCSIPLDQYPKEAFGFAVHFHGRTEQGLEVHTSAYFEFLTNTHTLKHIVNSEFSTLLHGLRNNSCKVAQNSFLLEEVSQFLKQQETTLKVRIDKSSESSLAKRLVGQRSVLNVSLNTLNLQDVLSNGFPYLTQNEGDECLPDQESSSEDIVCQLTDEWAWVFIPDRIMNARKGDTVLSPSGTTGPVSNLLHQVTPPQRYAHCGIMVQNFYTLRHCVGSEDWLKDALVGTAITGDKGTEGLDPEKLKYFWPGTVTQSVNEAVNGTWLPDPDGLKDKKGNLKSYRIAAFDFYTKDNGNNEIVEPLVVKPNPIIEAQFPQVRELLHRVAEEAKKINAHYRFYCYSDSSIALNPQFKAPDKGKNWWASNTIPSQCAHFIWASMHSVQDPTIHLEGPGVLTRPTDLEQSDKVGIQAVEVDDKTLDGLYLYTETERQTAARKLYQDYYDMAYAEGTKLGIPVGQWLYDAPDDLGNQICNTFAFDWSGENADGDHAKDSDKWKNPGDGRAVSPQNILNWDSPRLEGNTIYGVYGYSEKLVYRPARLEWRQISRWKKVNKTAKLTGSVVRKGTPQMGAFVTAGGREAFTNRAGRFELTVPAGRYSVESRILADGFEWEGRTPVDLAPSSSQDIVITLNEPSDWFREVSIYGTMNLKDEENVGKDEFATRTKLFPVFRIGAFYTHREDGWTEKMGGEVRAELSLRLDWQLVDSSVNVTCNLKLFEGASEDTGDLDGEATQTFNIQKDAIDQECKMFVRNDDEDDDDHVDLVLKISNRRQP
jgi:hypothetical protein